MRPNLILGVLALATFAHAAPPDPKGKPMPAGVKLELFREVDRRTPSSARAPRPIIEKCELQLPAGMNLVEQKLVLLPWFGVTRPPVTLGQYLDAVNSGLEEQRRALFPPSLDVYLKLPEDKRLALETLIEPRSLGRREVLVAWRGEEQWYVDRLFYRFETLDASKLERTNCADVVEGSLHDFLELSPLLAARRDEGLSPLRHPQTPITQPSSVPALELSRSPGMPNTRHFRLVVLGDGSSELSGVTDAKPPGERMHRLTDLLIRAKRYGLGQPQRSPAAAPRPGQDEQTTTLRVRLGAVTHTCTLGPDTAPAATRFAGEVAKAFGFEL